FGVPGLWRWGLGFWIWGLRSWQGTAGPSLCGGKKWTQRRDTCFNEAQARGQSLTRAQGLEVSPMAPLCHFRRPNFFPNPEKVSEAWLAVLSMVSWVDLAAWSMAGDGIERAGEGV
uniref:Uncharacterized protein n=1 Tax=Equus asinus TaxID=9793 RepID=A0A9L0JLT4_EQUAS